MSSWGESAGGHSMAFGGEVELFGSENCWEFRLEVIRLNAVKTSVHITSKLKKHRNRNNMRAKGVPICLQFFLVSPEKT
jgi:hypothetical protein